MKRLFALVILFSLLSNGLVAQAISESTRISILTADGGNEIYNTFGHTAIRVSDSSLSYDVVYNYGTFDFGAPGFIQNFIHGRLDYYVNAEPTEYFIVNYQYQNRSVHEQFLNLDSQQKASIIAFLEWNALPEHRGYRYDFLFDNCATRVRDIFIADSANFQVNYAENTDKFTFRNLIHNYSYKALPLLDWGMDLLLGTRCDRVITAKELTFLPDYIYKSYALSYNKKLNAPLVSRVNELYIAPAIDKPVKLFTPFICNSIILVFSLLIIGLEYKKKRHFKVWDAIWMFVLSILGILMTYEWLFTEHTVTKYNFNILWANPIFLFTAIFLFIKSMKRSMEMILLIIGGLLLSTQLFFFTMPQQYHLATYPIIWAVLIRILWICYGLKKS